MALAILVEVVLEVEVVVVVWCSTVCSCFWHAADMAPLEGLLILRCAIYDPLEGLQISKVKLSEMRV